jgi:hypothetical protein
MEMRVINVRYEQVQLHARLTYQGRADSLAHSFARLADDLLDRMTARSVLLMLSTKPSGATIFLDGEPLGISPLEVQIHPNGPITLRAELGNMVTEGKIETFEKDTLRVRLVMSSESQFSQMGNPYTRSSRIYVEAGYPLKDEDSQGLRPTAFSALVDYGETMRMSFGMFLHRRTFEVISDADAAVLGTNEQPDGTAFGVRALVSLAPQIGPISPLVGVGIMGVQRTITLDYIDGNHDELIASFSFGGTVRLGVEFDLPWGLRAGVNFSDAFVLEEQPVRAVNESTRDKVFLDALEEYETLSQLMFSLGIRF